MGRLVSGSSRKETDLKFPGARWWAVLWFIPYPAVIAVRIRGEEQVLERDLPGYTEYKQKVKYRLIPFVW